MVWRSGALVETASVPRIRKSELPEIEVVAELVAEGAQERPERRDLLPHRRPHPYSDQHGLGIVVAEKLAGPVFTDSQRSGCEHADAAYRRSVEL